MSKTRWIHGILILVLALSPALLTTGCKKRQEIEYGPCTSPSGYPGVCVGVTISFQSAGAVNAWSLYQTREVDPAALAHDAGVTPTGTLSITLNNGQTVTYSGPLYLDGGTSVPPARSGYTVLVYRPSNPGSLQNFIDQYQNQASSASLSVNVRLRDVSNGGQPASAVDTQGHASYREYLGTVNVGLPNFEEEFKDQV